MEVGAGASPPGEFVLTNPEKIGSQFLSLRQIIKQAPVPLAFRSLAVSLHKRIYKSGRALGS